MVLPQIAALGRISRNLAAATSLTQTLEVSAFEAAQALRSRCALVLVWDETLDALQVGASYGFDSDFASLANEALGHETGGLAQEVMMTSQLRECPHLEDSRPSAMVPLLLEAGLQSAVGVPLGVPSQNLGALMIYRSEPGTMTLEDQTMLVTLNQLISAAVYNAKLLAELHHANERLESANRLQNDFVAIVSHELRTPMTAMKGYALLLQETDLSPSEQSDAVRIVAEQTDRLTRILDDLLDLATIESGRVSISICEVDVASALERIRSMLTHKFPDRPLEILLAPDSQVCHTDPDKLEQILLNLADNACKYALPGTPIVLWAKRTNGDLEVRVHNDGPGLSDAERAGMFEKFRRLDRTRKLASGTGLGLYIAKQLVEALGGRIWIQEGENAGVTFCLRIPANEN